MKPTYCLPYSAPPTATELDWAIHDAVDKMRKDALEIACELVWYRYFLCGFNFHVIRTRKNAQNSNPFEI